MILCDISIMSLATLITALSALLAGFYLWYDRRARLMVSIELVDKVYCITIENVGKSVAKDISISISTDFIESLPIFTEERGGRIRQILLNIQKRKFYFAPGIKKHFYLMQCPKRQPVNMFDQMCNDWYEKNKYTSFRIEITYNGWYESSQEFFLEQFNTEALLYKDSSAKIADSLKELVKIQKSIKKNLSAIKNKLDSQNNE